MSQQQIDALLAERRGYVLRGLTERVRLVDDELARLGHRVERTATRPAPETTAVKRGRPRKGD